MKNKISIKLLIVVQLAICFFSLSSIASKFASNYPFLSKEFISCYAIEILILGIYALAWQQIIKRMDISIAYANKATGIFWTLLWSSVIFKENITISNIIGIMFIFFGVILVNKNG